MNENKEIKHCSDHTGMGFCTSVKVLVAAGSGISWTAQVEEKMVSSGKPC